MHVCSRTFGVVALLLLAQYGSVHAQDPLATPLEPAVIELLTNEISGQMAFNNLVRLAGAPWLRERAEFTDTFYEARVVYDLVRGYGIETVQLDRYPGSGTFDYPTEGEFWVEQPERRLIARLGADAAMLAYGSQSADVTGELIYLPPSTAEQVRQSDAAGAEYRGKVALMWSHPNRDLFEALDDAGLSAVVSFAARERYFDPNQVVYSRGGYADGDNLRVGVTVSWRQWSELLEDVESGAEMVVRVRSVVEKFNDKFETVFAWIPGTEPEAKGVIFTGHLFEGYVKRGTNDDMGGPAIQLEVLRALTHLIESGQVNRPRRTMYFLWPNEISGTYEFIKHNPDLAERWSININMDMVSEGLRENNSVLTMSETPAYLPSYLDGLAKSMLNYVWRTNDIVYLPDSPRGRPGGQYYPEPMWEKNGSIDAFRFYIHEATGGSDHICFNNPSVAVPGIELFTWPDQWYHADADLPDKADPTEMKRVAFVGAATALVAADLTDYRLNRLLDDVSEFGYARIAERGLPQALELIENASSVDLQQALGYAVNRVNSAVEREIGALESISDVYSGTAAARAVLENRIAQWGLYRQALTSQLVGYAHVRARQLGTADPEISRPTEAERRYAAVVPSLSAEVRFREFYLDRYDRYQEFVGARPNVVSELGLTSSQTRWILNFVNGTRSVTEIRNRVAAVAGDDLSLQGVAGYLNMLQEVGWVVGMTNHD